MQFTTGLQNFLKYRLCRRDVLVELVQTVSETDVIKLERTRLSTPHTDNDLACSFPDARYTY